jgi:hypothetical protein
VTGNLIYNSGTALALKSGVHVSEGHHNTVVGNQEGVNLWAKAGAADGGHGTFDSMIVWNNTADVKTDALSTAAFTFSNISSAIFPGTGNISSDPDFVGVLVGNFALRSSSPCIGTGKDGTDMGAVPFTGGGTFIRGDSDANGGINITDVIFSLGFLFQGGEDPACMDSADSNDDGAADISDAIYTLFFLFLGGDAPPLPYPAAGPDPTADSLPCN